MADGLEVLIDVAQRYRRSATDSETANPANALSLAATAAGLEAAASELQLLRAWSRPVLADYGDISDLPAELIKQLSGIRTDDLEDKIHATVKAAGESIDLDRLLIELYRRFGEIHERKNILNKAYRMIQKGILYAVPGRKGIYTTKKPIEKVSLGDINSVQFGSDEAGSPEGQHDITV
jgi:hypothetical protein